MNGFDDLEDNICYCVYCYEERNNRVGCCGENHFMTGKELKEEPSDDKRFDNMDGVIYE